MTMNAYIETMKARRAALSCQTITDADRLQDWVEQVFQGRSAGSYGNLTATNLRTIAEMALRASASMTALEESNAALVVAEQHQRMSKAAA